MIVPLEQNIDIDEKEMIDKSAARSPLLNIKYFNSKINFVIYISVDVEYNVNLIYKI